MTDRAIYPDDLAAMMLARAGQQWEPSNGTEGGCFHEAWCCECARDKVMNGEATQEQADADDTLYCPILGASFRGEAKEWQIGKDGQPCCTAFTPMDDPAPIRCTHTLELPLGAAMKESPHG